MSGGGSPATSEQDTKISLPKWVEQASKSNYEFAKHIAKKPMPVYKGQEVADLSGMTQDAFKYRMGNIGAQDPLYENAADLSGRAATENDPVYDRARGVLDRATGMAGRIGELDSIYGQGQGMLDSAGAMAGRISELDPRYAEAHGLLRKSTGPWDPTEYLNPYTEEVENRAIANANRSVDRSLQTAGDRARKAGAFGGSGSAIEKGVLAAEGARGIGDLSAELRRAGYDKATADMLANREQMQKAAGGMITGAESQGRGWLDAAGRMTEAGMGKFTGAEKQGTGWLDSAGRMTDSANSMITSADAQNKNWLDAAKSYLETASGRGAQVEADIAGMLAGGGIQEANTQKKLDAARAKFYEKRDRPLERLNIRLAALGMSPYGQREHTTATMTPADPGTDWASVILGGAKLGMGAFGLSDRRDKKDIQELGKDEKTGIPIYAYRYKDAKKGSPKVVGPMAQDIERVWPDAVREVGGHKVVRTEVLGMLSA